MGDLVSIALALAATAIAAVTDLRARVIPNWLTLPCAVAGVGVGAYTDGASGAARTLLGIFLCGLPPLVLFRRGALGGGDVKLFAGLGALLGARAGLEVELASFVLISGFVLWTGAWHGRLWVLLRASLRASLHVVLPSRFARPETSDALSTELPLGGAIFIAMLAMALRSA